MNSRNRFLAAVECRELDRPPVWFMRQAGRYLPEYRALKEKYSFTEMAQTPELAVEVTMQPLQRFPLDAAIVFSDILVIPEALGQPYYFKEEGGIGFRDRIEGSTDVARLDGSDVPGRLDYVADALRILRKELGEGRALLGFGGSPWTLATYMVEGGSPGNFERIKAMVHESAATFNDLMEKLTTATIDYFNMQVDAGVDAIQIFDSWGSAAQGNDYEQLSLQWIRRIIDGLNGRVPVILFAKGMAHHLDALSSTGAKVLSMDWTVDLSRAGRELPPDMAVQGNLDPIILNTLPEIAKKETRRIIESLSGRPGHIFNLGHGILPQARIECVEAMVAEVVG
ncbi:MAG: uroporphyrinogen decarboxylase [Opitutae bacterium]|nr:uroporphyrinogen decarboxylase [Opitutae bacterium]